MKKNKRSGQSLVEYLILVCLIAVSGIAIVSVVGQNIRARYANISSALRGKRGTEKLIKPGRDSIEMRDFEDFEKSAKKQGTGW